MNCYAVVRTLIYILISLVPLLGFANPQNKAVYRLKNSIFALPNGDVKPAPKPPRFPPIPKQNDLQKQLIRKALKANNEKSGGGWNGSGGGGVACFRDNKTAETSTDAQGRLRPEALNKIKSLSTNEFFIAETELEPSGPGYSSYVEELFKPREDENATQFLERVLIENYNNVSPLFVEYMLTALEWVRPEHWVDQPGMLVVQDMGKLDLPKNCRYVQLMTRYQRTIPGSLPEGFIDVDMALWKKMESLHNRKHAVLNQALLMLHEALYLLGVELNHHTSIKTQGLGLIIMSENFANYVRESKQPEVLYQELANFGFHHFANILTPIYLENLKHSVDTRLKYNKLTRFQSYSRLKKKLDVLTQQICQNPKAPRDCQNEKTILEIMNIDIPAFVASIQATIEEAFIQKSFFLSAMPNKLPNPEVLISLQFDDRPYLKIVCDGIRENIVSIKKEKSLAESEGGLVMKAWLAKTLHNTKANLYCKELGI